MNDRGLPCSPANGGRSLIPLEVLRGFKKAGKTKIDRKNTGDAIYLPRKNVVKSERDREKANLSKRPLEDATPIYQAIQHPTQEQGTLSSFRSKNMSTGGPPLAAASLDPTNASLAGTYTMPVPLPPGDMYRSSLTYLRHTGRRGVQ